MITRTSLRHNRTITLLTALFLTCLVFFAILATIVANSGTHRFDEAALLWINSHANSQFDAFFVFITDLGGVVVVTSVTALLFVYCLVKKMYTKALIISLGVGGAAAVGHVLKAVFERSRPDLWQWLITETNFSFPSGHAIGSSALALCIVVVLWRTKWRIYALVGALIYVLMVSFSRLYLGVHYPSDIVGGWLLSAAWVALITNSIYLYSLDNSTRKLFK